MSQWTRIVVSQKELELFQKLRKNKGFASAHEFLFHCVKACELYTKGQIIVLGETGKVSVAKTEDEMYEAVGIDTKAMRKVGEASVDMFKPKGEEQK